MMFLVENLNELRKSIVSMDNDDRIEFVCKDVHSKEFKIVRLRVKDNMPFELHEVRDMK